MSLTPYQRNHFEVLMGNAGWGARRAWVDMPMGAGKGYVAAAAIRELARSGVARRILYVTPVSTMQSAMNELWPVADGFARIVKNKHRVDTDGARCVVHCTERMWLEGHDTWIKYGSFDLVVLDLGRPPMLNRPSELAAIKTTLALDSAVWILGAN